MADNENKSGGQTPTPTPPKSGSTGPAAPAAKGFVRRVLFGGWKRWILFAPLALFLGLSLVYIGQPVAVLAWHFMPPLVLAFGCAYGLLVRRLSLKARIATASGVIVATAFLILGSSLVVVPLLLVSYLCGFLMSRWPKVATAVALPAFAWLVVANTVAMVKDYQLAMHLVRNTEEVTKFPVTINDRNLPRSTAFEYSVRANDDRTREVGRIHIAWVPAGTPSTFGSTDGKPRPLAKDRCVWLAPLQFNDSVTANKFWNSFWGSVHGVISIDCSDIKMHADTKSGENAYFMFGADSWVTKLLFNLRHPLSKPAEAVYWQKKDGTWVLLQSYVTYQPTLSGTMIPVMGGVAEIGSYGGMINHSPEAARAQFEGAALFPPELARQYGEAYRNFRFGLDDYFWYQQGLLEISEDEAAKDHYPHENSQPHFQHFEGIGPQLVLPFEPEGKNAKALARVLLFDAVSGKIRGFTRKGGDVVNGPRTGLQNLHEAAPSWAWDQYSKVEPLVIHTADDRWYYQVTIVNKNHATVGIIVVEGVQLTPVAFEHVEDVQKYIRDGKRPVGAVPQGISAPLTKDPGLTPDPNPALTPGKDPGLTPDPNPADTPKK